MSFGAFFAFLTMAAFGPWIAPYNPLASDTANALQGPSAIHWFGTDQLGRDILSRLIVATRLDLGIAGVSVALAFLPRTVSFNSASAAIRPDVPPSMSPCTNPSYSA